METTLKFHSGEEILQGADTVCALINARTSCVKFGDPTLNSRSGACHLTVTTETKKEFSIEKLNFKSRQELHLFLEGALKIVRKERIR